MLGNYEENHAGDYGDARNGKMATCSTALMCI